jgi:hypothetical protein
VSNKTITNRPPSDYLADVQKAAGSNLNQWLESNLISDAAFRAALADDYDAFLAARCATIDSKVSALTAW